jgi:hypothetical protein
MILVTLFFILASMLDSLMDTLVHHFIKMRWYEKIKNSRFWNVELSNANPIYLKVFGVQTKYKWDSWHVAKSAMVISLSFAGISAILLQPHWIYKTDTGWHIAVDIITLLIAAGIVWNVPFNILYNQGLVNSKTNTMKNLFWKNLLTGWRLTVVVIGGLMFLGGFVYGLVSPHLHGSVELEHVGDGQRHTAFVICLIGVAIILFMFVYNYINSRSEKGTEIDNRYK